MSLKLEMTPIGHLAQRLLKGHIAKFRGLRKAVLLDIDPEAVHQMRVMARSIRVTLRVYQAVLPLGFEGIDAELKWIAASLGRVRDVDVMLMRVPELSIKLNSIRIQRFEKLREDIASSRYKELSELLFKIAKTSPEGDLAQTPTLQAAPEIIGLAYRSFKRGMSSAESDEGIHCIRKRAKRLRYTVEPFVSIYGKAARTFLKQLKQLQEVLGSFQDAVVALDLIAEMQAHDPNRDFTKFRDQSEALKSDAQENINDCLNELPAAWKKLERKMKKSRRGLWK